MLASPIYQTINPKSEAFQIKMPKNLITTCFRLAVRSTGKPSNTATFAFAATRNAQVSIVRALNTPAISEPALSDTSSKISQQQSPEYAYKTSMSAKLRSALETSSQVLHLHTLNSSGYEVSDECKAAILLNIENAKRSNDEEYVTDQIAKAFKIIAAMKLGYCNYIEEEIYGPLLNFLIDMKMVEEFHMIVEMILGDNDLDDLDDLDDCGGFARLGYYKMLLWINLKDEEKIKEVFSIITKSFKAKIAKEIYCRSKPVPVIRRGWEIYPMTLWDKECPLSENYLLALCDKDHNKEVLSILETLDITRVYSFNIWTSIFEHLGRSISESVAKKILREMNKNRKFCRHDISGLIFSYVTIIPNLWVGGAILKFNELLKELEVSPSSKSYQKLIKYSCDSREENVGLSILKHMYEIGLDIVSSDAAIYLFRTIEKNYGFDLLRGVEVVLKEMNKNGDKSIMFNLRLAEYILEVLFGRCEQKEKEGDCYKPWLMDSYFRCKLDDYKQGVPHSRSLS